LVSTLMLGPRGIRRYPYPDSTGSLNVLVEVLA
jgi:hypothetical protein